jgi:hypothetical protein
MPAVSDLCERRKPQSAALLCNDLEHVVRVGRRRSQTIVSFRSGSVDSPIGYAAGSPLSRPHGPSTCAPGPPGLDRQQISPLSRGGSKADRHGGGQFPR